MQDIDCDTIVGQPLADLRSFRIQVQPMVAASRADDYRSDRIPFRQIPVHHDLPGRMGSPLPDRDGAGSGEQGQQEKQEQSHTAASSATGAVPWI